MPGGVRKGYFAAARLGVGQEKVIDRLDCDAPNDICSLDACLIPLAIYGPMLANI